MPDPAAARPGAAEVVGVLLAGGAARRLGGEGKAALELCGRPLLSYPLRALRAAVADVAIVIKSTTRLPQLEPPPVRVWLEPDEPRHPLVGLRAALRRAGGRSVLACAVDLPLLTGAELSALLAAWRREAPAAVPVVASELQPHCAIYSQRALEPLERASTDEPLQAAVMRLDPQLVQRADPGPYLNINTEADLRRAAVALGCGGAAADV